MARWIKSGGGRYRPTTATGGLQAGLASAMAAEALIRKQIEERRQQRRNGGKSTQTAGNK